MKLNLQKPNPSHQKKGKKYISNAPKPPTARKYQTKNEKDK